MLELTIMTCNICRRTSRSDDLRRSREELAELIAEVTPDREKKERKKEEEKEEIQRYIAQKRAERMRQFREKQEALREREVRPFQSAKLVSNMI